MSEAKRIIRHFISLFLVLAMVLPFMPQMELKVHAATSGTLTGLSNEDIVATYTGTDDGANSSWSVISGNSIKGSVIGTDGTCSDSQYNTTLTIQNNKNTAAVLSFDYTIAQNSGSIQVAGTTVTANGSYSGTIEAGSSINIYIGSGSITNATTIDITNLFLIADVQATTTFQPSENGSYTVDGEQITGETVKTQQSTIAYELSATADDGYKFLGWYSVTDNKFLSSDAKTSVYLDSDQTITAIFTEENNPVFDVSGNKFTDLNEANNYASTNDIEKITLISDGILPSGDYTISDGVILLIPFDAAATCYTTTPASTGNSRTSPSVYRKLTMENGASIQVDGAISVSAKHYAYSQGGASGAPDGKYGYIYMNEGSSITVNNGGAFYVYGFVSGDGLVTAKSGATVYENMQIADFRGGSATLGMYNNAQKIFPFNQYFVQNIETKLIMESGADEYVYTSIYASSMSASTSVHFIGNDNALFSVSEGGTFTKEYLPDQDRVVMTVNGDASINSLSLSLSGMSVSSENYVLPINNCMTLNAESGTVQINQDIAMLAGSQLNIAEGATIHVTQGRSMYVYDADEWTKANYASNAKFKKTPYSPTRTYTRTNSDLKDVVIDINGTLMSDGAVYTTASGADITSSQRTGKFVLTNGAGTNTSTYMYKDYTTNYDTIAINSAKLHNGTEYAGTEDEYTLTDNAAANSVYYWNTSDNKWKLEGAVEDVTVTFETNGGNGEATQQSVPSGTDTVLNANTFTRDGYTFAGWNTAADGTGTAYADGATVNLTEDVVLYAQWKADSYTVTWLNEDGTELEVDNDVAYGTMPEYNGETPVKESNAQYSYVFAGWTPEITAVTGDVTYKAVFEQKVNQYTITWKNWDGSILSEDTVNYGEVPVYTESQPVKDGDSEHSYVFAGWTPEITAVTGNAEYTAEFTENINLYTVIWQNWDGTELERDENVPYGTTPEYNGSTPVKEGDAQYSFTFTGWSPEADSVTGNITYTAVYTQTVNQYTITWMNGDTVLKTELVAYGETPVYSGEIPVKEGDAQYSYSFTGWTPEITSVTGNATYNALFEETLNTYTVKWVNEDGTILETDEDVAYGTKPEYNGTTPTKKADEEKSYEFKGWTPEITDETVVTGDVTYTAVFEEVINTYTVIWANEDGSVLETDENVAYGTLPEYNGIIPEKEADENYTYTFKGWTPEVTSVTGDVTYTATYEAAPIVKHTIHFDPNGGEGTMDDQVFIQGVDTPLNKNTFTKEGYHFTGWNTAADGSGVTYADEGSLINLTEDVTLYAQWKIWDGWFSDDLGTTYYKDGEKAYFDSWSVIDGKTYYFDQEGYIVKGLYRTTSQDGSYEATFIFDENGIFQDSQNGLFNYGEDTYWTENGRIVEYAGLVRVVNDDGEINYYYFAEDNKAIKNTSEEGYLVEKNNGLPLPAGISYLFDQNGVIIHDQDTSKNGVEEADSGGLYYFIDGVKVGIGLVQINDDYYYAKTSSGQIVCGQKYWITQTNGLLEEGAYEFDEDGRLIFPDTSKNGIVSEDGTLYYYENGKLTYAGLIEIDGDYYYVRSTGEVVHGQTYWITKTNGLLDAGEYEFSNDGVMSLPDLNKNGIVSENGSLYYYENGKLTYAGLIEINGDYYYVKSTGEVVHGQIYWPTKTNGLLEEGSYYFADDGKLVKPGTSKNGIVSENGSLYYYENGKLTYAGLIEIDGDYYYVRSTGEVVHGQSYWITKNNGILPAGQYDFDESGKIINN